MSTRFFIGGRDVTMQWSGIVEISPQIAQACLERNQGNRRIRPQLVDYLSRCILSGEWQEDHPQPVVFSNVGRMIDGQHRMCAIIKADKPTRVNVLFGVRDELREYIDTGISRQLEDRVSLHDNLQVNRFLAAIINCYSWLASGRSGYKGRVTPEEAHSLFNLHKDSFVFAAEFMAKKKRGITRTAVAVAATQLHERNRTKAEEFIETLCTVDGEVQQARFLRDWLISSPNGGGQGATKIAYMKTVTAMRAYLEDRPIKVLRAGEW